MGAKLIMAMTHFSAIDDGLEWAIKRIRGEKEKKLKLLGELRESMPWQITDEIGILEMRITRYYDGMEQLAFEEVRRNIK